MPAPGQHVFSEKVALVTGATTPVGRAVSMQLGLYGCYVIAAHKTAQKGDSDAISELKSLGTLAHSFEADLSGPESAAKLIDQAGALFQRLDILVICPEEEACADDGSRFQIAVDTRLAPVHFVIREALRLFEGRPKPRIVNVIANRDGDDELQTALNAALESLTRSYSISLPSNFRVNAVSVREDRAGEPAGEELDPELFRPAPKVDPDDVARAVVFLLSSEAKGVNGQILEIG